MSSESSTAQNYGVFQDFKHKKTEAFTRKTSASVFLEKFTL